jgi:tRNA pseudouridine13 synthase
MDFDLALPFATAGLSGVGGRLRATPDHFVVEEVALYETAGDGQHLYVNLTKAGLTTKEVQLQLERLFGLKRGDVGFAGMKDKHARTTQTFSLAVGHKPPSFADEAATRMREHLPVTVNWVAFHRNKLRPGHLLGNRFRITLVDLQVAPAEALARSQAIVAGLQERGLPNYFGPQRLGKGGANAQDGLAILLGEQQKHDRWLRRFLVSSYQSYLCNRYLAVRLERGLFAGLLAGDIAKKHATGGMFAVEDLAAELPRFAAQEISFTAPIYGPRMWETQGDAGRLEAEILATSPATLEHFARLGIDGTRRLGRLLVPDLQVTLEGESLLLSFMLPKGAFATTVVRELTKIESEDAPAIEDEE